MTAPSIPYSACQFCNARITEGRSHRDWCPVIGGDKEAEMINREPMPKVVHRNIRTGEGSLTVGLKTYDATEDEPEMTTLRIRVSHSCSMAANATAIDLGQGQITELLEAISEYQGRVTLE